MKTKILYASIQALLKALVVPPGFTKKIELKEEEWCGKYTQITLDSPKIRIELDASVDRQYKWKGKTKVYGKHFVSVNGHTHFLSTKGGKEAWYCYDQPGIGDSFYMSDYTEEDVNAIIAEQITKVAESVERLKTTTVIPGINRNISKDSLDDAKKDFKKGKSYCSNPHGFGTGYVFSPKRHYNSDRRATTEQEEFFGHSPLFISERDCD